MSFTRNPVEFENFNYRLAQTMRAQTLKTLEDTFHLIQKLFWLFVYNVACLVQLT